MKTLVFLLVLANLLLYAFIAGYFGHAETPDAGRVDQQVQPERMRIVSRGEAPAAAKTAEPAKPEAAVDESKPAANVANGKNAETAVACLAWEHLPVADADRLQAMLTDKYAEFKVQRRTEAGESNGWWVFVPPLASKAEADKKASELRRLGVTDYFILQDGASRFAISLGVFSSEKGGQDRLAELKEKGIRSARLTPRPGKESQVALQASGPLAARTALLEAVSKVMAKPEAQDCK